MILLGQTEIGAEREFSSLTYIALTLNLPLSPVSLHGREMILYGKTGFNGEREMTSMA
jgi:hypothetical protein